MGGISSLGVGSGLNANAIVQQLVSAERAGPERRLVRAETEITTQLSAYASLKSQVAEFSSAIDGLKDLSGGKKASPTNTDAFTVSATAEAALGSYNIEVLALAQGESRASVAFNSRDEAMGTGSLSLAVGDDEPIVFTLTEENNSLTAIRDAINNAEELPVTASLINDGSGERLVLQSTRTGAAEAITVSVTDDDGDDADGAGLSRLAESSFEVLTAAQDASLRVNGLAITRSTNQISDALDGITLTLKAPSASGAETVSVTADNSKTTAALDKFIKAYNTLSDSIGKNTAFDAETGQGGPLLGDGTLRSLESAMRNTLLTTTDPQGNVRSLVDLGLSTNASGTVSRSGSALEDALSADPDGVNALLDRLGEALEARMGRFDGSKGLVATRIEGFEARLDGLDDQRERLNRRLAAVEARYTREFSALDGLIAGMNQTSNYLSAQLGALNSGGRG
jgi:flagellar hook-associated protein 2